MSLGRACLRLSAVAALRNATIAGARVFDSKIGSIEGFQPTQRQAMVVVFTEEESGEALSGSNGGPPFRPHVELVFEISMVEALFDEATAITDIGCPTTDSELEAALDTLEAQIRVVLFEDVTRKLSSLFRKSFLRAHHYQSLRFREETKAERFARRYVIIKFEIADETVFRAFDPKLEGLDLLPPIFAAVAKAWPDDLPEKAVAIAMAAVFQQPGLPRGLALNGRMTQHHDPATTLQSNLLRPQHGRLDLHQTRDPRDEGPQSEP